MPSSRWITPTLAVSALLAFAAPASATAPKKYCVQNGANAAIPCPATGFDQTFNFVADAMAAVVNDGMNGGITGDTVQIEPGTYNESPSLDYQDNVSIFGDPAYPALPVITSSQSSTFGVSNAKGATLRHLEIDNSGPDASTLAAAVLAYDGPTLTDVAVKAASQGVLLYGGGTLDNVRISELPGGATFGAGVRSGGSNTNIVPTTLHNVTINVPDFPNGVVLETNQNHSPQPVTVDGVRVTALGTTVVNSVPAGIEANSEIPTTISHSTIDGGMFGVLTFGADTPTITDSILTARTSAAGTSLSTALGLRSAAAAAVGQTLTSLSLRNVTAVDSAPDGHAVEASGAANVGGNPLPSSRVDVSNSILRGAGGDAAGLPATTSGGAAGTVNLTTSDYVPKPGDGVNAGAGNISADPLFVNKNVGSTEDFHLKLGSPAVDAGAPVPASDVDLDGVGRPDSTGSNPDMGAYESTLTAAAPPRCKRVSARTVIGVPVLISLACPIVVPGLTNTYRLTSRPLNGSLTKLSAGSGTVVYTPSGGFTGRDTFAYQASNAAGSSAPVVVSIVVARPPRPAIANARQSHRKFELAPGLPRIASRQAPDPPPGTTFSFSLNEPAQVTLSFVRRKGGPAGSLSFAGKQGVNKVHFLGQISRSVALTPGGYKVVITAVDAVGHAARPVTLRFTVVK